MMRLVALLGLVSPVPIGDPWTLPPYRFEPGPIVIFEWWVGSGLTLH